MDTNYLLTISYHSKEVAEATYKNLVETMVDNPCKVILLDNLCPLMEDKSFLQEMCIKYGFQYCNVGKNLGLHEGYNYLRTQVPPECDRVILFDGDSYPVTLNWHIPLLKVHDDPRVVWSSLHNQHSYREMGERGFSKEVLFGYKISITKAAVINSVSCFTLNWVDSVKGFSEPHEYYGGFEVSMWAKKPSNKLWVFLDDYTEVANPIPVELIYSAYKVAHAFKGENISFEDFIEREKHKYIGIFKQTKESLTILQEQSKVIGTFHHHTFILLDIVNSIKKDKITYVEIGAYLGSSAALVLNNKTVDAYSIDGGEIPLNVINSNVQDTHPGASYKCIKADSHNQSTLEELKKNVKSIDVLFIDGDHSKAGVIQDYKMYSPLVSPGGYIVFDDYSDSKYSPEVKPAVDSLDKKGYHVIGCLPNSFNAYVSYPMIFNNCFILRKI